MADFFPTLVYALCFATSSLCAWLLFRSYRKTSARLLMWSAACFILLAVNNLIVIIDILVLPNIDFRICRLSLSLGAVLTLLFGFIWDLERDRG
jgi:hypothetical protein